MQYYLSYIIVYLEPPLGGLMEYHCTSSSFQGTTQPSRDIIDSRLVRKPPLLPCTSDRGVTVVVEGPSAIPAPPQTIRELPACWDEVLVSTVYRIHMVEGIWHKWHDITVAFACSGYATTCILCIHCILLYNLRNIDISSPLSWHGFIG